MSTLAEVKNKVAEKKVVTVYDFLESKRDLIAKALPNTITPERMIGIFSMLVKSSPELTACSQTSLIGAVIQTVQLGLTPGNIGHCYYIPFNNKKKDGTYQREVQFILGYRGIVELVNRSGKAVILGAEVVYENDEFECELGLNPVLKHKPTMSDRGTIKGVYCIAKNLVANEKVYVYLRKDDIDKVRASSKAGSSDYSPWSTWYEEMAKKTAVKRLCKLLPLSVDIQKGVGADETVKTRIDKDMVDIPDETNYEIIDATAVKSEEPVETPIPDQNAENSIITSANSGVVADTPIVCKGCDIVISPKVAKFSKDKYGKELCIDCQKSEKK